MERLTLEQINAMTPEQMREYLRGLEVENQRKDMASKIAEEEARKAKEENDKFLDDFFKERFANQHPRFHDQY